MDRRAALRLSAAMFVAGLGKAPGAFAETGAKSPLQPLIDYLSNSDVVFDEGHYEAPEIRAAFHRHVFMVLSGAYIGVFGTSVERPDWVPYVPYFMPYLDPNPDTVYKSAPIDPLGTYKLSGRNGTETISTITLRDGGAHLGKLTGKRVGEIDLLSLKTDSDNAFSFVLSAKPPRNHSGQWFALPPDASTLMSRRVIKESSQKDGVLRIVRLDRPKDRLLPTDDDVQGKLERAAVYASTVVSYFKRYLDGLIQRGAARDLILDEQVDYGGLKAQSYFFHRYALEKGEVLIAESDVPASKYWSIQLFDPFAAALEFVNHQTSLNDVQARVDSDGKVRIVISPTDPAVANWLDTGGWRQGWLIWRWNDPRSTPRPTLTKVGEKALKKHLPKDTVFVSAQERAAMLNERSVFYQSRSR